MNKSKTIESLLEIKKFHETQMKKLQMLLSAKSVDELEPPSKEECEFGKWLYSYENHMQDILGLQFYENLENLHSQWHKQYYKIHSIFFSEAKKGFLSKLMRRNKVDDMQIDKAVFYYSELKIISNELLNALASSHRRLVAMSESKFY